MDKSAHSNRCKSEHSFPLITHKKKHKRGRNGSNWLSHLVLTATAQAQWKFLLLFLQAFNYRTEWAAGIEPVFPSEFRYKKKVRCRLHFYWHDKLDETGKVREYWLSFSVFLGLPCFAVDIQMERLQSSRREKEASSSIIVAY